MTSLRKVHPIHLLTILQPLTAYPPRPTTVIPEPRQCYCESEGASGIPDPLWLHSFRKCNPMATKAQIAANRRNAKKSTGPKTAEGKAASCMNALRHGLRAEKAVLPNENEEEYAKIHMGLQDLYQPQTLISRLATCCQADTQGYTVSALDQ